MHEAHTHTILETLCIYYPCIKNIQCVTHHGNYKVTVAHCMWHHHNSNPLSALQIISRSHGLQSLLAANAQEHVKDGSMAKSVHVGSPANHAANSSHEHSQGRRAPHKVHQRESDDACRHSSACSASHLTTAQCFEFHILGLPANLLCQSGQLTHHAFSKSQTTGLDSKFLKLSQSHRRPHRRALPAMSNHRKGSHIGPPVHVHEQLHDS